MLATEGAVRHRVRAGPTAKSQQAQQAKDLARGCPVLEEIPLGA